MAKKNFDEIRKHVEEQFDIFAKIEWGYLNEEGIVVRRTYGELIDILEFVDNLKDLVYEVDRVIFDLTHPVGYVYIDTSIERNKVAEKLRKYIRWNVDNELWETYPEFANRKEN